jgi:hypothetical protein
MSYRSPYKQASYDDSDDGDETPTYNRPETLHQMLSKVATKYDQQINVEKQALRNQATALR